MNELRNIKEKNHSRFAEVRILENLFGHQGDTPSSPQKVKVMYSNFILKKSVDLSDCPKIFNNSHFFTDKTGKHSSCNFLSKI